MIMVATIIKFYDKYDNYFNAKMKTLQLTSQENKYIIKWNENKKKMKVEELSVIANRNLK